MTIVESGWNLGAVLPGLRIYPYFTDIWASSRNTDGYLMYILHFTDFYCATTVCAALPRY